MTTQTQVRLNSILETRRARLLQARDFRLREGLIREVGQRRPPPQRERAAQPLRRRSGVTVR
jgi:hypothetical protein